MKTKKVLSVMLALIMAFALVPVVSLAENIGEIADEAADMRALDEVRAALDRAEADAIASGADRAGVINAVYEAALNLELVDADSFSDFTEDGFFFTVDGMYNAYSYRLSTGIDRIDEPAEGGVTVIGDNAVKGENSADVLLIGPFYGADASFTDAYKNVAGDVAKETGGKFTVVEGKAATAKKIVEEFSKYGVIFVDSHGNAMGETSYIDLTTNEGITADDFRNGWAAQIADGVYGIDGRYIEHYLKENGKTLDDPFVWIGACEGMMASGKGATGQALLNAGSAAVYGYSQSVTFEIDLKYYLPTFWKYICDGLTVAESFEHMKAECIVPDPFADSLLNPPAYPVIMSDVDPFPENPDSIQTVKCDWKLFDNIEEKPLESISVGKTSVSLKVGEEVEIPLVREPQSAAGYEVVCTTSNDYMAVVTPSRRNINILAIGSGSMTITCKVMVNGREFYSADIDVLVTPNTRIDNALNVDGGKLQFGTMGYRYGNSENEYLGFYAYTEGGRTYARSGIDTFNRASSDLWTFIFMKAGETLTFDYFYSSEPDDIYRFTVNGEEIERHSGESNGWLKGSFTAVKDGLYEFHWIYEKDFWGEDGEDCVEIDNVKYSGTINTPVAATGDPNGDGKVTMQDALITLRCALHVTAFTSEQIAAADMNGNGEIEMQDALSILRLALAA